MPWRAEELGTTRGQHKGQRSKKQHQGWGAHVQETGRRLRRERLTGEEVAPWHRKLGE